MIAVGGAITLSSILLLEGGSGLYKKAEQGKGSKAVSSTPAWSVSVPASKFLLEFASFGDGLTVTYKLK